MPRGKKITENPEMEAFVIKLLKEGCSYRDIAKKAKDQFDIKIPPSLLSGYIKNYLPPEVILPEREKRGRPRKDWKKRGRPIKSSEFMIEIRKLKYKIGLYMEDRNDKPFYHIKITHPSITTINIEECDETIKGMTDRVAKSLEADIKRMSDILEKTKELLKSY